MENKLNIAHIDAETGWRGGQQQAAYLIEGLNKENFKTYLICQPNSSLHQYAIKNKINFFAVKMRAEADIFAGFKIARFCREKSIHILHLHSAHAVTIGIWAKLFFPNLKLIAVRRVDFHIKNIFSRIKYNNKLINKIVCISEAIKNVLIEDKINEKKLETIYSGINLKKFDNNNDFKTVKQELNIPEKNIVVGTVAALAGHKDYPTLLKAAQKVLLKNNKITFLALGDGPEWKKINDLHIKLKLKNNFILAGFKNNIGSYLKIFDIFVLASKKEGLGTSILDAQSLKLPVIACKTGGIPEAVKNDYNGVLIKPGDYDKLSEEIIRLAQNSQLRAQMGESGFQSVQKFSIQETIKKNIALYKKLVKNEK